MRIIRCSEGHFYDGDAHDKCPMCIQSNLLKSRQADSANEIQLPPLSQPPMFPLNKDRDFPVLPKELDGLSFVGKIGSGSIGNVYHVQKHIDYAIKEIEWKTEKMHQMAINEFVSAKLFSSQNVLSYQGYYEKDNSSYILMEKATPWISYCCQNIKITVQDVLNAVSGVCDALEVIHSKGYQHFDVKPSNIFVGEDGTVKLGDFSHSFCISKGKSYTKKIGTYQFMAPEIYDSKVCSGKEDLYSLGITLYMMITGGKLPFDFGGRESTVRTLTPTGFLGTMFDFEGRKLPVRQKNDRLRNFYLNSEMCRIIEKAIAYDPKNRYRSLSEFKERLQRFANDNSDMMDTIIPHGWSSTSRDITVLKRYSTCATMGTFVPEEPEWGNDLVCKSVALYPSYDNNSRYASVVMDSSYGKNLDDKIKAYFDFSQDSDGNNLHEPEENAEEPEKIAKEYEEVKKDVAAESKEIKGIRVDEVQFGIVAEKEIESDDIGIIEIGMFTRNFKDEVLNELSKEFSNEISQVISEYLYIREQSEVTIKLYGTGVDIDEDVITRRWNGKYLKFSFDYSVPENFKKKKILFKADIFFEGIIATTLKFTVNVNSSTQDVKKVEREDVHSAYISYARENIAEVTYLIQAIRKIRPDLDIFFDIESLRSGENWKERVYAELLSKDKLFLCWSHFAAASKWVNREWMYMLEKKGLDSIEPFPLEDTHKCPVPKELRALHFNDVELMIRNVYNSRPAVSDANGNEIIQS